MANRKKEVYNPKPMTEGKRNIIQGLLQEYDIETAADIQDALKDLLSGTLKELMETEMDDHLGYDRYERSDKKELQERHKTETSTQQIWRIRSRCSTGQKQFF
jgi:putative transposase